MLKKILRVLVFLLTFAGGVVVFSNLMNTEEIVRASDLEDPTLPVVCMDFNGIKADRLFGCTEALDPSEQRETLIPLSADKTLSLSCKPYENTIRSAMYEITTPDTGVVVANAQIGNFKQDGEYQTASFTIGAAILMNCEYPIRFTLELDDGREIYYYARLIQRARNDAEAYLSFVTEFYETCLNKSGASSLNVYLESDNTVTSDSFTHVTLKSSFDQVTWGSLSPRLYRRAVPTIHEINNTTGTVTQSYVLEAVNDDGETELYRVEEYYRLRYDSRRIRLLDFERSAVEIFDPAERSVVAASSIAVGVTTSDLVYKTDSANQNLAFVQDDTLWCFSNAAQKLSCVFTYHKDTADGDERCDNSDYAIEIIRVTTGGDIDFVVSGYHSRGVYEGRHGILVCRYLGESACVEERFFIPDDRASDRIAEDLDRLSYVTPGGSYYVYLKGSLYRLAPGSTEPETVLTAIDPDCFVASGSQSRAAWMNEMAAASSTHLTVMNFDDGTTQTITADEGTCLKAVGFINDDFIYGIADKNDLRRSVTGRILVYLRSLTILGTDGETVMTYEKPDMLISSIAIKSGLIELQRVSKNADGSYTGESTDNIMNNRQTAETAVTLKGTVNSRQGRVYTLMLPTTVSTINPLVTTVPLRRDSTSLEMPLPAGRPAGERYYVYGGGELQKVLSDPAEAIRQADSLGGTVLTDDGTYLYERGGRDTDNEIANADIPAAIIADTLDADTLQERAGDSGTVLDLTGCSLDQVLYEVSCGRPVLARTPEGGTALIVGYNTYNTRLYDFATGEHYWYGINDSTALFAGGGNVFLTILEPQATLKS